MPVYRKKPIEVEAIQWTGKNLGDIERFVKPCHLFFDSQGIKIRTKEGVKLANVGDFVIRDIAGECFLHPPAIFAALFEQVTPEQQPPATGEAS
ncbi:hypothetical protein [Aeromonas rivipollensis]|uniref:hypothetical protein n=1 Tax=Aeromonas rivipollensis TaxID=948519 RepID=UPI0038CF4A3C